MNNFEINLVKLPKYLTGTPKNGILLLYNGPLYHLVREWMKKENPEAYNALLIAVAKSQNPHSEVVMYTDANGNLRNATNTGAGFVSGTDPIGAEVVAGAVLSKPLELAGRAALYGLGRAGNNWARARLISRKMNDVVDEGLQYFGKVKYYGPTMGKTTAAKTNHDLVDFDDFTREAKNELAKKLNISPRVLQSDPKYALAYLEMLEKLLDSWRRNPLNSDKTLVISKKGLADKNVYNNEPSIPDRQTFVQRLRNRGETDDANSNDWYNMLLKQNPNLKIDNRFVSEIEYNPHYIGFYPVNNKTISKSVISDPNTGELLYTPDELIKSGDFARAKEMSVRFFYHPVVLQSYKHNQELAERLGITIPDKNASEVVKLPVKVTYKKLDNEIANVAQSHYGDPDAVITMDWSMYPLKDLRLAVIHENLHRGFYSAPLRLPAMSKEYYNNVYIPEYRFWEWKTKKLLKPEYHNGYLADIHGGEAGTNFIDLGRDLGLKLGLKYPGYETVKAMLENYKGFKRFMIPLLNDSKAGMRHVWDAMTGKYFTPTAIGIGTSSLIPSDKKGSKILIKKKNRGKFTEYCGGEVTNECILKAKKSKNPKLRKRATFAANARKWKH